MKWNSYSIRKSILISFPHALSCSPRQEALREYIDSWHQVPALSGEGEWGIVALSFLSASGEAVLYPTPISCGFRPLPRKCKKASNQLFKRCIENWRSRRTPPSCSPRSPLNLIAIFWNILYSSSDCTFRVQMTMAKFQPHTRNLVWAPPVVYMRVWSSLSIDNRAPKVHEMAMFRKKNLHFSYLYDLYRYYILLLTMNGQVEYTWTIQ